MNTREAVAYLKETHEIDVQPDTIRKWLKWKVIVGCQGENGRWEVTEECLDEAIDAHNIPRKVGRKATLSKEQRERIRDLYDHREWTQKKLANRFQVSVSYISLIVRGLR